MSAPFSPGDHVLSLPMEMCVIGGHNPEDVTPEMDWRAYRVIHTFTSWDGRQALVLAGANIVGCAGCFRPIRPNESAAHESWSELLRNPQPEGVE